MAETLTPEELAAMREPTASPTEVGTTVSPVIEAMLSKPGEPEEITLQTGLKVVIQKPVRAVNVIIARALGLHSTNVLLFNYYRTVTWVTKVGGLQIPKLRGTSLEFDQVCEMLGDDGLDELSMLVNERIDALQSAQIKGDELKNS
jgi:hypothetical protein